MCPASPCLYTECAVFRYNFADGSYFTGSVDSLGRPSQAEYYSKGLLKYNGSFLDGQYHGYGEYYGDHGDRYQGQFYRGQITGDGVWINTNENETIDGEWLNGTVSGDAVWQRDDGVRLEGEFRRGHAHGPGLVIWRDRGYQLRTSFKKGYPHGPASLEIISDNATDPMWTGHFTNGVVNGDTIEPSIRKWHSLL